MHLWRRATCMGSPRLSAKAAKQAFNVALHSSALKLLLITSLQLLLITSLHVQSASVRPPNMLALAA